MIPYQTHDIAKARLHEARERAAVQRLRRSAHSRKEGAFGVRDAVGHGLIAIGSRLVSDTSDQPNHRRAA